MSVQAPAPAPTTDGAPAPTRRRPGLPLRPTPVLALLGGALVAACLLGAAKGAYDIPAAEVLGSLARRLGLSIGTAPADTADSVLWQIRLPRVALAVVVGGTLGCAGTLMQGSFANPLAEPGIIGVSSGAALGAVLSIVLGVSVFGSWSVALAAFVGGLVTVVVVYRTARSGNRTEVVTLVLTGVAVNAMTGAVIGLAMYFSSDAELRSITFWNLGSVAQATWPKVAIVAPLALVGLAVSLALAPRLDLLSVGDRSARHLGVDVERLRVVVILTVALLTASAVAVAGIIAFVGLVVPHAVRMLIGPRHRALLVGSTLGGALVLVVADLVARTVAAPAEVPLGVLTALIGSPFFFYLLRRTRARQGGWA